MYSSEALNMWVGISLISNSRALKILHGYNNVFVIVECTEYIGSSPDTGRDTGRDTGTGVVLIRRKKIHNKSNRLMPVNNNVWRVMYQTRMIAYQERSTWTSLEVWKTFQDPSRFFPLLWLPWNLSGTSSPPVLHNDLQDEHTFGSNGVDLLLIIGRLIPEYSSWQMGKNSIAEALIRGFDYRA